LSSLACDCALFGLAVDGAFCCVDGGCAGAVCAGADCDEGLVAGDCAAAGRLIANASANERTGNFEICMLLLC
jgi:hypothetical protein